MSETISTKTPVKIIPADSIHLTELDSRQPSWVLPGFARAKTLTLISAAGGTSKSILTAYAALMASTKRPFFDNPPPKQYAQVTILALDAPLYDYASIFRRLAVGYNIPVEPPEPGLPAGYPEVRFLSGNLFDYPPQKLLARCRHFAFNLGEPEVDSEGNEISDPVEEVLPDLIIVDSLSATHTVEENSANEMKHLMLGWREVANQGPAVVIIHHHGKPKERDNRTSHHDARGSSAIHDSVDMHLTLYTKTEGRHGKTINARWRKGRGADLPPKWSYTIEWDNKQITLSLPDPTDSGAPALTVEEALGRIEFDKEYTHNDLAKLFRLRGDQLNPLKLDLTMAGRMQTKRRGRKDYYIFLRG